MSILLFRQAGEWLMLRVVEIKLAVFLVGVVLLQIRLSESVV
jgi:hypothetical protein